MTPSKTKKALPSSTSITFSEHPITPTQWKAALQRVKLLYLKGRLKECSTQCSRLLSEVDGSPHPLNASYLNFYFAISTEGISRQTHIFSAAKIQLLKQAKACYQAAASSLPRIESVIESHEYLDSEKSAEHALTSPSTPRAAIFRLSPTLPSSPAYSVSSPLSLDLDGPYEDNEHDKYDENEYGDVPKPSPLRIRKTTPFYPLSPLKTISTFALKTLPSSPPPTPPPTSVTFTSSAATWLQTRSFHRFSSHLFSFTEMLAAHMTAVNGLLLAAEEAQANRHAAGAKRLPSHGADDETRAEDRRWRIARLREQGWRRKRFEPGRYATLCEKALAEL